MSPPSSIFFHASTILFGVAAMLLNIRLIATYFSYNHSAKRHFSTLFLSLFLYLCYNISSTVYAAECAIGLISANWSKQFVFWSGCLTFSLNFVIVVCNCCITVDRIVAMRKPVFYVVRYSRYCRTLSIVLMLICFVSIFFWYSKGITTAPASTPSFAFVSKGTVIQAVGSAKNVVSLLSVGVTLVFIRETRLFLRKQLNHQIYINANQIVVIQLIAEAVFMIFPDMAVLLFSFFGISLLTIVGPIVVPSCEAYTLACAALLTVKLRKTQKSQRVSTITPKSF
ncbi:hypothetical protein QR680_010092 [Steinernema hermaphroditum]|uniref:Uncharacterized protein n=1 Tax=Steinernema hermaphroditum TaxID=289476 RepID=A0AA39MAX1_9BILA|nr:hypothetical protein QR680_010092 [Steinernema hermaphroditum]